MTGPRASALRHLTAGLRGAARSFAEGLAYFGVCYGYLPPYGWRSDGAPGRIRPLDEPPPGHPERLVPADRSPGASGPGRRGWVR